MSQPQGAECTACYGENSSCCPVCRGTGEQPVELLDLDAIQARTDVPHPPRRPAMTTAREQLLDVRPQSEQVMTHLLDAYRVEICEQIAQEIDAASLRNLKMHPGDDAMVMRRLGLAQAARIARVAGGAR